MRVLTVVGNRPQFIKASAVSRRIRERGQEVLIHTGQHFDDELSAAFFRELDLPAPDRELGIGGGSNTSQTARMLSALEEVLETVEPSVVLVYGDTNSTLAGALAGAQAGLPVAHVEAGMRAFDRTMPEELNRVLVDHASTLLLCSSQTAVENLRQEGVTGAIELVGDVMVDVAMAVQPRARERRDLLSAHGLTPGQYALVTVHRAGNVDEEPRLERLLELLEALPITSLLPLHPRTRRRLEETGLARRLEEAPQIALTPPLGYVELQALLCNAQVVLTDSGGLQKEAYLAGVPCITLRARTEWVETVEQGWNVLVDLDRERMLQALRGPKPSERPSLYGAGDASERVLDALTLHFR